MTNQDWSNLGNDIRNLVQSAIDSRDFQKLNETVNRTINTAMEGVSQGLSQAKERRKYVYDMPESGRQDLRERKKQDFQPPLYKNTAGMMGGGVALSVTGYILAGGLGLGALILLMVGLLGGFLTPLRVAAAFLPFIIGSGIAGGAGTRMVRRVKRFRIYTGRLRQKGYCSIRELAGTIGKSERFVKKDVQDMISRRMFLEGHLDQQETCLIASNEMYEMYCAAQAQLEERQRQEISGKEEEHALPQEAVKVIEEGKEYIRKIRACNDAIPGQEISGKISHMEMIVQKIFGRVEQQPELVAELHQFMDYYLPTTVKLLEAYQDMASQPVQGPNILSAKREIEDTLDTVNQAFEKLLDGFFQDTAWDVSTDISVLQTMLAQEGLTKSDFEIHEYSRPSL